MLVIVRKTKKAAGKQAKQNPALKSHPSTATSRAINPPKPTIQFESKDSTAKSNSVLKSSIKKH